MHRIPNRLLDELAATFQTILGEQLDMEKRIKTLKFKVKFWLVKCVNLKFL